MKNLTLKVQLEGLRDIGLDRVNNAVAAVFVELADLESQLNSGPDFEVIDPAQIEQMQSTITLLETARDQLKTENRLLRAELDAVYKAAADPTPKNETPSPNPGFAGDPPGGSPGAV